MPLAGCLLEMANRTHPGRRGTIAGSLGTKGVSRADRGKAFLGSNQDFCPNSLCAGILWPSYKSNPEPEDWPGFWSFDLPPSDPAGLFPSCFLNSRPGTMKRPGKSLPLTAG